MYPVIRAGSHCSCQNSRALARERSKTRVGSGGGSTIKASLASISFVKLPRRVSPVVLFHGVNPTSVFPGAQSPGKGSLSIPRLRRVAHTCIQHCDCKINKLKIDSPGHSVLLQLRRGVPVILCEIRTFSFGISTRDRSVILPSFHT